MPPTSTPESYDYIQISNDTNVPIYGWVASPADRGSIDILWSCCVTIVLCCWISVYPNVGSPTDKWYHPFLDKFNLFCIAILGPDFLFGIAWGQFSSARRSVKLFKKDQRLGRDFKWTYTYAFFVDMGGIHLTSPDFPQGFPIDTQQLHYLIIHNHIDPPDMEKMDISERNSTDILSRLITIFQAFWFLVNVIQRWRQGLRMTTLELTATSFSLVMLATSVAWYFKPSISQPRSILTKDGKTVEAIREYAQRHTHPLLPARWYRTPLEHIGHDRFGINVHWRYYTRLVQMLRVPFFSRPVTSRPWDRFPSDAWLCPDFTYTPIALCVLLGFSIMFIVAWNFYFPTYTEKVLWRICSVYHAVFSIYGGVYFLIEMSKSRRRSSHPHRNVRSSDARSVSQQPKNARIETPGDLRGRLHKWRNNSADHDPEMGIPLRILAPVSITCILYVLSRGYIYVEDFISLRAQPSSVYIGVNKFIPFLGS